MCWGAYALYATSSAFEVSHDHGMYITNFATVIVHQTTERLLYHYHINFLLYCIFTVQKPPYGVYSIAMHTAIISLRAHFVYVAFVLSISVQYVG